MDVASSSGNETSGLCKSTSLTHDSVVLQEFLKSEVSAENILFWQACEKFRQIPADRKDEVLHSFLNVFFGWLIQAFLSNIAQQNGICSFK